MSQEVIEITEREIEVIEVVEKGPAGPVGPQANINYTVVSSAQTLSNSQNIAADTSGGSFTLTLPANPNAGDSIDIFDYSETFDTNPLTIARNGENIESIAEDLICNVEGAYFTMIYTGATRGWQILPRYGTTGGGGESVLTTQGDMVYRGAAINERLPIGSAGQILKVNSGGNAPEWGAAPATGVTSVGVTGSDGIEVDSGSPVTGSGSIALGVNAATLRSHINVADGAEVNVQSNWTEADSGSDAFILNKPSTFTPSAHAASHATAGSDAVFDQDLNTTDNVLFADIESSGNFRAVSFISTQVNVDNGTDPQAGKFISLVAENATDGRTQQLQDASGTIALTADIPDPSSATPQALGVAAAGTSSDFSRADHVHAMPSAGDVGAVAAGAITTSGLTQATARILGRTTASTGAVEELTVSGGASLSAGELAVHAQSHAITSTSDHTAGNHKVFYSNGSGEVVELALGDSGKVLQSNGATSAPTWETPASGGIAETLLDAKGDLIVASAADTAARLAVGANGTMLVADSGETTGVKWAAQPVEYVIACSDETTDLTTGTAKVTFRAPVAFLLTAVAASVNTAPTGSTLIVDLNNGANSALSTKLSIDASEKTSATAATAAVIDTTYDDFAADAEITIDIDQTGSSIAGKGLKVILKGTRA